MLRAVGSLFGIGSVSAYVLQHARLPTAVVQEGTVITNAAASQPVCPEAACQMQCLSRCKQLCLCCCPP